MSAQKKKKALDPASRQAEMEGARLFGKHVSETKGRLLLAVTLVCCALPVGLGLFAIFLGIRIIPGLVSRFVRM